MALERTTTMALAVGMIAAGAKFGIDPKINTAHRLQTHKTTYTANQLVLTGQTDQQKVENLVSGLREYASCKINTIEGWRLLVPSDQRNVYSITTIPKQCVLDPDAGSLPEITTPEGIRIAQVDRNATSFVIFDTQNQSLSSLVEICKESPAGNKTIVKSETKINDLESDMIPIAHYVVFDSSCTQFANPPQTG